MNKVGEKSKAVCHNCKKIQTTTFKSLDVPTTSGKVIKGIIAAVCDCCEKVVAIPHESSEEIKKQLSKNK